MIIENKLSNMGRNKMKEQKIYYCLKCQKRVETREVDRWSGSWSGFDSGKVSRLRVCVECGTEVREIVLVDPLKEVLCEEKQSKPAPKGNIQKLTVEPEEKPLRCSIELSAQIVREIVTELKGIRETLEKLVTQNKWEE
jgi:hypothetical protein